MRAAYVSRSHLSFWSCFTLQTLKVLESLRNRFGTAFKTRGSVIRPNWLDYFVRVEVWRPVTLKKVDVVGPCGGGAVVRVRESGQ